MTSSTISRSDSQVRSSTVYEYSLIVVNPQDNDSQKLTAAFSYLPTSQDWQQWLTGWLDCGYSLYSEPFLIRTI